MNLKRYPNTSNRSLKAWNAADELLIASLSSMKDDVNTVTAYNDTFGYLTLMNPCDNLTTIITNHSQEKALNLNIIANNIEKKISIVPLTTGSLNKSKVSLIKIPKSIDLFHFMLMNAHSNTDKTGKVYCGFMTRHFSPKVLDLCHKYFENVNQSKAVKKARVITLSNPKHTAYPSPIHEIQYKDIVGKEYLMKQYYGVFSARHIDYATQFLLENIDIPSTSQTILDLASGNGIIAKMVNKTVDKAEIHLMDDSLLAVESGKMNIEGDNIHHHCSDSLDIFNDEQFDLVICNPPFHFGHENTIEISLALFQGVMQKLKENGTFILVANKHLNYSSHLEKVFPRVTQLASNQKFEILSCSKNIGLL